MTFDEVLAALPAKAKAVVLGHLRVHGYTPRDFEDSAMARHAVKLGLLRAEDGTRRAEKRASIRAVRLAFNQQPGALEPLASADPPTDLEPRKLRAALLRHRRTGERRERSRREHGRPGSAAARPLPPSAMAHPGSIANDGGAPAPVVLGLDLSLGASGMVAVPGDWGGDWSRIARATVGKPLHRDASEAEAIGRLVLISSEVVAFAEKHRATAAIVEGYAFSSRHSRAHALGELGGVVKMLVSERCGIPVDAVPPSSARKLLLGKHPRKDVKIATRVALTRMGMPREWTDDEADAFVVANWVLAELGGYAFVLPEGYAA